jgi:hypothetical protein
MYSGNTSVIDLLCLQIPQVECVDSSKSAVNQKTSDVNQDDVRANDDEQTPCSKGVGKRSAEKDSPDLAVYDLDGAESATKTLKLKCVKIEPKD